MRGYIAAAGVGCSSPPTRPCASATQAAGCVPSCGSEHTPDDQTDAWHDAAFSSALHQHRRIVFSQTSKYSFGCGCYTFRSSCPPSAKPGLRSTGKRSAHAREIYLVRRRLLDATLPFLLPAYGYNKPNMRAIAGISTPNLSSPPGNVWKISVTQPRYFWSALSRAPATCRSRKRR
jgi:hypothetical protein